MGSKNKRSIRYYAIICSLFFFTSFACNRNHNLDVWDIRNYNFDPDTPVLERVNKTPDFVLNYLIDSDHRPDYSPYTPSQQDMQIIEQSINSLPPSLKKVISQRVLGLYFVNNFQGNGFTERLSEKNGMYYFMAFNPLVLKSNISELLTSKELTCFRKDIVEIKKTKIAIDCGTARPAFLFILMHETAHVVKGVNRINTTPYEYFMWESEKQPAAQFDFPLRKMVTFYSLNGGPKIPLSDALELYDDLQNTPFASLYGSQTSGEDFAELLTFYHLTQKMNLPYKIIVFKNDQKNIEYEPMKNTLVMGRFPFLEQFYQE